MNRRSLLFRNDRAGQIFRWILIVLGTALMALSVRFIYEPANLAMGGFSGIGLIVKHLTDGLIPGGMPLWLTNIILNIPLILAAVKIRGWKFIGRTFAAALLYSLFLFIIPNYPLLDDLFLAAVCGGALLGAGLALVLLGRATTGGTDTLAVIIQHFQPHLEVAGITAVIDGIVIFLSFFIFGLQPVLYAVISVLIMGKVGDMISMGRKNARLAYIISDKWEEIEHMIIHDLDRGATRLAGRGSYTGDDRPILMCAVSKKELVILREAVAAIDENAFVILGDVREIRGEGFLGHSREEL